MLSFTGPELLVIDDLALRPLRDQEPEDLYEIIRQRHERGALVVGDQLLANAAMDRRALVRPTARTLHSN